MIKISDIRESDIMFYDIETDHQFAAYAELKMIGVQYGFRGEPQLVESWGEKKRFRSALADPDIIKVQFNGINFDETLTRAKFEELNLDLFKKTLKPVEQVLKDANIKKTEIDDITMSATSVSDRTWRKCIRGR